MTIEQASQWLGFFQRRFALMADREDLPSRWQDLVKTRAIKGVRSHDVRLVGAMQCYGITHFLTFNVRHFGGFGLTVIDPTTV
jgi:hypothetical protein